MSDYTTKPALLEALQKAAGRTMTKRETREQQISFVLSAVHEGSAVSRAEVEAILNQKEGTAA